MGNTFRVLWQAGGEDAVEREFGYDERVRFVAHLLDGEQMSLVCREFGISRKTGYKILTATRTMGLRP
jgi:transposase-like protein